MVWYNCRLNQKECKLQTLRSWDLEYLLWSWQSLFVSEVSGSKYGEVVIVNSHQRQVWGCLYNKILWSEVLCWTFFLSNELRNFLSKMFLVPANTNLWKTTGQDFVLHHQKYIFCCLRFVLCWTVVEICCKFSRNRLEQGLWESNEAQLGQRKMLRSFQRNKRMWKD